MAAPSQHWCYANALFKFQITRIGLSQLMLKICMVYLATCKYLILKEQTQFLRWKRHAWMHIMLFWRSIGCWFSRFLVQNQNTIKFVTSSVSKNWKRAKSRLATSSIESEHYFFSAIYGFILFFSVCLFIKRKKRANDDQSKNHEAGKGWKNQEGKPK